MKPVSQTRYGQEGNCLSACIAPILEVPIDKVDFTAAEGVWLERTQAALSQFGFFYLGVNITEHYTLMAMPRTTCIFVGNSKRFPRKDFFHCVVGELVPNGQEVVFNTIFDPHEIDPCGIDGKPTELGFLIPLSVALKSTE
jgi:hypothetical protein